MPALEYHFLTRWNVAGTAAEVSDVLGDARELPRWWPAVYLAVEQLEPGDERGIGRRVRLHTKGFLPYTLSWELQLTESPTRTASLPRRGATSPGRGIWRSRRTARGRPCRSIGGSGPGKPLLRLLSPLFRPLLSANHRWAMARGEESLELELARRRATLAEKNLIPAPPPPVSPSPLAVIGAGAALGLAAYALVRLAFPPAPAG